jgi:hypothetical protein
VKRKKLFLIANTPAALLTLVICAACSLAHAQYCNPALVSYIVRDENGKRLTEEELKSVAEQLPQSIGDAQIYAGEVSLKENGRHFYRQESVDWDKGEKVPALHFINDGNCAMQLGKVTLTYHGKRMRLFFNISITRKQDHRRWVIDALPFQEGTFVVSVDGCPWGENEVISADRWEAAPDLTPDEPHAPLKVVTDGKVIFKPILLELQKATRAPLRLPAYLAAEDQTNQLYAMIGETTATSYVVYVSFCPNFPGGGACQYGFVSGARLGAKTTRPRGRRVPLARGLTGYFVAPCRALCPSLSWVQSGYIYTVGIHAAELGAHRKMANSAIVNNALNQ